ncbi:MAG: hypothetical protein JSR50_11570 [Proteobacteria bacterium]|nr:hypothetical protein [Pseudomonadota bacterium]
MKPTFQPSSESLRLTLTEIGDRLAAQLVELHKRPDASKAEMLAIALDGARRHVLAYRESLVTAAEPVDRPIV